MRGLDEESEGSRPVSSRDLPQPSRFAAPEASASTPEDDTAAQLLENQNLGDALRSYLTDSELPIASTKFPGPFLSLPLLAFSLCTTFCLVGPGVFFLVSKAYEGKRLEALGLAASIAPYFLFPLAVIAILCARFRSHIQYAAIFKFYLIGFASFVPILIVATAASIVFNILLGNLTTSNLKQWIMIALNSSAILPATKSSDYPTIFLRIVVNGFIIGALIEESAKFLFALIIRKHDPFPPKPLTFVMYCGMIGLGYATVESFAFGFGLAMTVGSPKLILFNVLSRTFLPVPIHLCCGLLIGARLTSLPGGLKPWPSLSSYYRVIWLPYSLHGVFSFCAFALGQGGWFLLFYIGCGLTVIAAALLTWRLILRMRIEGWSNSAVHDGTRV